MVELARKKDVNYVIFMSVADYANVGMSQNLIAKSFHAIRARVCTKWPQL